MTVPVRLYLVRHAQARADDGSYDHDTPLSARGRRQAEALAEGLAKERLAAVYASPSRRARETAAPLAQRNGLDVSIEARLLEFEVAGWNPDADEPYDWATWRADHRGAPDGETLREFAERVGAACEAITARREGEAVAIVSHAGTTDAILRWAMSIPAESDWRYEFDLQNAAVVELLVWPGGRHPQGPPRFASIVRGPALDHLPASLRSGS